MPQKEDVQDSEKAIGIDVGISNFAVLSNGKFIENQRYLAACEARLFDAQSKKDKLPHRSPERRKAAKKVSHIYERLGNSRDNFAHQLSHRIVDDYGIICLEDIDIKNLIEKKPYMAKSVLDASWNRFRTYVMYKAESAGRKVVLVNPAYTSQRFEEYSQTGITVCGKSLDARQFIGGSSHIAAIRLFLYSSLRPQPMRKLASGKSLMQAPASPLAHRHAL